MIGARPPMDVSGSVEAPCLVSLNTHSTSLHTWAEPRASNNTPVALNWHRHLEDGDSVSTSTTSFSNVEDKVVNPRAEQPLAKMTRLEEQKDKAEEVHH